jgi:hypothetical protein
MLIALLFWEGDKEQAMKLARLLADLEIGHSTKADFLFVSRFDSKVDPATVKYVSRRFNTYTHISRRRGVGWPVGCNSIFFGGLEWIYHKMAAGQVPNYKSVLILGADTTPLIKDWIDALAQAWNRVNAEKKTYVAGAMSEAGGRMHINGDCMLLSGDLKFLKWLAVTVGDVRVPAGWDWVLASEFERWGWADINFIKSLWRKATFQPEEWERAEEFGIKMVHGVKDFSLQDLVRKKICLKKL